MNKVVLSRKYRPKRLSEVVGQEFAVKTIMNAFKTGNIAHAFLFTGIRGVGKTTIARIIAMGLNCILEQKPIPDPCNECKNCIEIKEDRFDEVLELDAASHTSVDDIREIISYVKYRPSKGRYKVFIIDEVHMLSNSAFNALLKTIEEPPEYVKFIFCTTELNKIPITILSRCQKFELTRVTKEKILLNLENIIHKENIRISKEALVSISRFSEGSIRDSITILEQAILSSENAEVSSDDVDRTIGYSGNKLLLNIYLEIVQGNCKEAIHFLTESYNLGASPEVILNELLHLTYALLRLQSTSSYKNIYDEYNEEQIDSITSKTSISLLNQFWQIMLKAKEDLKIAPQEIEALEIIVIRLCYSAKLPTIEQLVHSINNKKGNDLNINIDNNSLGNDIEKILNIFPGSKLINKLKKE